MLCVDWLVMTAPIVASLPVPEVVGITNRGQLLQALYQSQPIVMSSPALCLVKAMTFAQSMDEPPTAIIAVAPDSRRIRAPASTYTIGGQDHLVIPAERHTLSVKACSSLICEPQITQSHGHHQYRGMAQLDNPFAQ